MKQLPPAAFALALLAASPAFGGDRELGAYLASECVTCHQLSGQVVGGVPAIVGWPEDAFIAVMGSYARKERDNQVMHTVAAKFSADEVAALAAYFGSLPLPTR